MNPNLSLFERAAEAARTIRRSLAEVPGIAVVLGSGLAGLADQLENRLVIPYETIPHFPRPTVAGHEGLLSIGSLNGGLVALFQGRFHSYEGHDLETVTLPVRVIQALGIRVLILTASVGAISASIAPGTIVVVSDHLNLLGANPLRGLNDDRLGPRFPDLSEVYSSRLRGLVREEAGRLGIPLGEGVYAAVPGPSYETPAEIRMLRTLGADVVGMSTVPEAIVARQAGIEVLALALASNWAAGIQAQPITHDDVIEAGRQASPRIAALLAAVVGRLSRDPG